MEKEIDLAGIVAIVGNYGSGKTEISINLAVNRKRAGMAVRIADLDLVNPYFRTREAKDTLEAWGIDVVLPSDEYLQADLPILSRLVAGMIREPAQLNLLDVVFQVRKIGFNGADLGPLTIGNGDRLALSVDAVYLQLRRFS